MDCDRLDWMDRTTVTTSEAAGSTRGPRLPIVGGHDEATPIRGHGHSGDRSRSVLPFCVASDTERERAGITDATVTAMIVRGLIERDAANRLALTEQGRAALTVLIGL
jgi:hypothetical protein